MKHYRGSSAEKEEKDRLVEFLLRIAHRLRQRGVRVSTAEINDAARIIYNYSILRGCSLSAIMADVDELALLLSSTIAKGCSNPTILKSIIRDVLAGSGRQGGTKDILREVERDLALLRLNYNSSIQRSTRTRRRDNITQEGAYARLKLLGFIKRGRRGEYVVSRREAQEIASRIAKRYGSLRNALQARVSEDLARNRGNLALLLDNDSLYKALESLDASSLIEVARNAARLGRKDAVRRAAVLVSEKLRGGERVSDGHAAYEVLREQGLLDSRILASLVSSDPEVAVRAVKDGLSEMLASALRYVEPWRRATVFARIEDKVSNGSSLVADILERNNFTTVGFRGSARKRGVTGLLDLLSTAEFYVISGAVTDNKAYVEYGLYELRRLQELVTSSRPGLGEAFMSTLLQRVRTLRLIGENFISGEAIDNLLSRYIIALGVRVREGSTILSLLARSSDKKLRITALKLINILASMAARNTGASRRGTFTSVTGRRGHVIVRGSLVRAMLYSDYTMLRWRGRHGLRDTILVLDKSGSMQPYSAAALLVAASFLPVLKGIIVFDEEPVYFDTRKSSVYRALETVMGTAFEGYTDVVAALSMLSELSGYKRIVIISDFRQTVDRDEKVIDVLMNVLKRTRRLVAISPPTIEEDVRRVLEARPEAKLFIISTVDDAYRVTRRIFYAWRQ